VHISIVAFHFVLPPFGSVNSYWYISDISHQQVELESMRSEYTNVQLECNAADERAKLLASEVIGLEEKVVFFSWYVLHLYLLLNTM
jgi:hypothetical protein